MAEIIKATLEDLDSLISMGYAFFLEAKWDEFYEWDDLSASSALIKLINNPDAIVYVAKENGIAIGMASALLYPLWYNTNIITGQEFFLYVQPDKRNGVGHKLKSQLESDIRDKGARTGIMGSVETMPSLDEYYIRSGYALSEKTFIKRL